MTSVRISDRALSHGGAEVERELVQLSILAAANAGEAGLTLVEDHPEPVLALARSWLIPVAGKRESDTPQISDLWADRFRVTVIVACYNYGHFLDEAVSSVLMQSYLPDEIILSDDASSDDSPDIMRSYAERHPERIRLNLNKENQGIQKHFNGAVRISTGDMVVFLGADNRMPANYVELLFTELANDPALGIAYTDFALFAGRARQDYERMLPEFRGERLPNGVYCSNFPHYDEVSREMLEQGHNFIHGSSMYRREAFDRVGGYGDRDTGPEDRGFFQKILASGYSARKVTDTLLEYRQHSSEQANYQFSYFGELQRLREERVWLRDEIEHLRSIVVELSETVETLRGSRAYRLGRLLLGPLARLRRR